MKPAEEGTEALNYCEYQGEYGVTVYKFWNWFYHLRGFWTVNFLPEEEKQRAIHDEESFQRSVKSSTTNGLDRLTTTRPFCVAKTLFVV